MAPKRDPLLAREDVLRHFTREELDERYEMAVVMHDVHDAAFLWLCRRALVGQLENYGQHLFTALERDFDQDEIADALTRIMEIAAG